jgi:dTDP-4-amino-4,6-dideoxygalactose transaminase
MTVPFVDLKTQYQSIKPEIDAAVMSVLESTQFVLGDKVKRFEEDFAKYCGADHAIGVNSGTSALHLALLAAGVGPGDEVITVSFTFVATAAAICYTGAKPVFVEIEPRSFTMDPSRIEDVITERTKVILPVHLYGQTADMDPIMEIAKRHNLVVIEDAAQAHGAEYKGRKAGAIGHLGCFSFYPGKNLGAYGEGGMVVTSNNDYDRLIRMMRDWGQEKKYHHILKGFNYRMEGIQGAILNVKLRHLEKWTESRRTHAREYNELLKSSSVPTPVEMDYARHVYHVYAVRLSNRDAVAKALGEEGIFTNIHYPIPVHMQQAYSHLGYHKGDFPLTEKVSDEVLSLPMYPELTREQIEKVARTLSRVVHE